MRIYVDSFGQMFGHLYPILGPIISIKMYILGEMKIDGPTRLRSYECSKLNK